MKKFAKRHLTRVHLTFHEDTKLVEPGEHAHRTQLSAVIRHGAEGEAALDRFPGLPEAIRETTTRLAGEEPVLLYEFFHYQQRKRVTHGYIVTRERDHQLLAVYYVGPTAKSKGIIDNVMQFVAVRSDTADDE